MFNVLFLILLVFSWANGEIIRNMSFEEKNLKFLSTENNCNYTINGLGYNNDSKASKLDINNSRGQKNSFIVSEKFYWDLKNLNGMESSAPISGRVGYIFTEIIRLIGSWIMSVVDLYAIFAGRLANIINTVYNNTSGLNDKIFLVMRVVDIFSKRTYMSIICSNY